MESTTWELPPEGLYEVLSLIDVRRWGSAKFFLVQEVNRLALASEDGWCHMGYRGLARRAGMPERYAYAKLRDLNRRDHVLLVGDAGSGTRGTAYRLNPNPRHWRVGCWRVDPELREARFDALEYFCAAWNAALTAGQMDLVPRLRSAALTTSS